jgi:hypothetical protein
MYVQDGGFQPPKVEGLLPHFLALHQMMRRTLALRIWLFRGNSYL